MNKPEYLTIGIARKRILQGFTGQSRVPKRRIVTYVEKMHCEDVRGLSANEKMIVSDALSSLRSKGLADNFEHGYWSFQDDKSAGTDSMGTTNSDRPRKNTNIHSDLDAERTIGSGKSSVYLYYYQEYRDSAESKGEKVWACKIGRTIHSEVDTRIKEQAGTALPETPKIGLHIKTDKHEKIEQIIHDVLKVRGKHMENAPGREWFLTSPSEVEEIYKFIGKGSCERGLDGKMWKEHLGQVF